MVESRGSAHCDAIAICSPVENRLIDLKRSACALRALELCPHAIFWRQVSGPFLPERDRVVRYGECRESAPYVRCSQHLVGQMKSLGTFLAPQCERSLRPSNNQATSDV